MKDIAEDILLVGFKNAYTIFESLIQFKDPTPRKTYSKLLLIMLFRIVIENAKCQDANL